MNRENLKKVSKKVFKYLESKSFYAMLALCVGIIVFAGIFVTSRNIMSSIEFQTEKYLDKSQGILDEGGKDFEDDTSNEKSEDSSAGISFDVYEMLGDSEQNSSSISLETPKEDINEEDDESTVFASDEDDENIDKEIEKEEFKKEDVALGLPVIGRIIFDYSMDKPVYSKTLNDWRTHRGIDIEAALGTPVKATQDGVIDDVKNDPRFGHTVVIKHNKNLQTVYSSLNEKIMVKKGDKVKKGEVIGSVGNSAPFEVLKPPHLHFEVVINGEYVDPKEYLPELAVR